jgi:Tfp pilus assembly protein PilO
VTARDRLVVAVILAAAILVAGFLLIVSPERKHAADLGRKLASAKSAIATAETSVSSAKAAEAQYPANYANVVRLGKAVPPDSQVPSLIYELNQAANSKHVFFANLTGSNAPVQAPTTTTPASALTTVPFTFTFDGGFFQLYHFLQTIGNFAKPGAHGTLKVDGRLLTVQSLSLGTNANGELTATVTATAYTQPTTSPTAVTDGGSPSSSTSTTTASSSTSAPAPATVTP